VTSNQAMLYDIAMATLPQKGSFAAGPLGKLAFIPLLFNFPTRAGHYRLRGCS
jgi:hypothetical protein